jgi:hypothetical protein
MKADNIDILVVTYYANEDGIACSHHIDDRLAEFRKLGVSFAVLSTRAVPLSYRFIHYRVPSLFPSAIRFELRHFFRKKWLKNKRWKILCNIILFPLLPLYAIERLCFRIDPTWYWTMLSVPAGVRICRRHNIRCIYSTGGPAVAHLTALRISSGLGIRWVAEFQDPLIHGYDEEENSDVRLTRKIEREICRKADRIIFLTEGASDATERRVDVGGKGAVIYPGTPPPPILGRYKKGININFCHFGSLGGSRNLEAFLAGLRYAVGEEPQLLNVVRVSLYGNVEKDDVERIKQFPFNNIIYHKGTIPRNEALREMQESDVLLLIQGAHKISAATMPSKLYEYLHAGRPILGLVHKNTELRNILFSLNHYCADARDLQDIKRQVIQIWHRWENGGDQYVKEILPSPFTSENAAKRILSYMQVDKTA